jgi:hypothetical protein
MTSNVGRNLRRTEYAVPAANSKGKGPQVNPAQALSEECSETKAEYFGYGVSSEESSNKSSANSSKMVRPEYAVPTVNSKGKNPQWKLLKLCLRNAPKAEIPKTFVPKIQGR